jgi:hypothetical protein
MGRCKSVAGSYIKCRRPRVEGHERHALAEVGTGGQKRVLWMRADCVDERSVGFDAAFLYLLEYWCLLDAQPDIHADAQKDDA